MADPLVFGPTFEALERALGGRLSREQLERFRAIGVDFEAGLLPAYPYETWVKAMDVCSNFVAPQAPEGERHKAMGRRMVDSYGETLVGKALLTALRILGPKRTIERMARNLRTANNYTETTVKPRDDGAFELWCSRVASTSFYQGLLQRAVEVAGGRNVTVSCTAHDAVGATFTIRWDDRV